MDPILKEIYSLVLPSAPFVIGVYVVAWVGLFGYVTVVLRRLSRIESELGVVEESIARKAAGAAR